METSVALADRLKGGDLNTLFSVKDSKSTGDGDDLPREQVRGFGSKNHVLMTMEHPHLDLSDLKTNNLEPLKIGVTTNKLNGLTNNIGSIVLDSPTSQSSMQRLPKQDGPPILDQNFKPNYFNRVYIAKQKERTFIR